MEVFHKGQENLRISTDKAGIQKRGKCFEILSGQGQAVFGSPDAVPQIKSQIPEGKEHLLCEFFSRGGYDGLKEDHDIDIRVQGKLSAAISPYRNEGKSLFFLEKPLSCRTLLKAPAKILVHHFRRSPQEQARFSPFFKMGNQLFSGMFQVFTGPRHKVCSATFQSNECANTSFAR